MTFPLHHAGTRTEIEKLPPGTASSPGCTRRMRARMACEPCRERKRKCDGSHPCGSCVRFEYACHYVSVRGRRKMDTASQLTSAPASEARSAPPATGEDSETSQVPDNQLQPLEANSGAAFVRKLALALDPANAPRSHLFAWNLFLGARMSDYCPRVRPIVDIISRATMESLATIYLDAVDPCYGFIDHDVVRQRTQSRWNPYSGGDLYDAVLCGIAALGFLFSRTLVESAELDLIETAKHILEQSSDTQPGIDIVTGWVLRVAYLRMTASPHTAWMASCAMMHTIEASGIHCAQTSRAIPGLPEQDVAPDLWRRVFGIARHLNVWISFDLGRSRVILPHTQSAMPSARPGDYTIELLNLLPTTESLDTEKDLNLLGLRTQLRDVLKQEHTEPPSVLAQCNLALLLLRRLRALDYNLSGSLLDEVLGLTSRAIHSAQAMLNSGNPWHHVANVPFQILCILLAIDTPSSITQLADAVKTLSNVAQIYDTNAAKEALNTACLLVRLHQKRKETDAKSLAEISRIYSPSRFVETQIAGGSYENGAELNVLSEPSWLDELMTDIPNLQGLDVGQLLDDSSRLDLPAEWV